MISLGDDRHNHFDTESFYLNKEINEIIKVNSAYKMNKKLLDSDNLKSINSSSNSH